MIQLVYMRIVCRLCLVDWMLPYSTCDSLHWSIDHSSLYQRHSFAVLVVSPVGIAVDVWHTLTASGHHLFDPYRSLFSQVCARCKSFRYKLLLSGPSLLIPDALCCSTRSVLMSSMLLAAILADSPEGELQSVQSHQRGPDQPGRPLL